MHSVYSRGNAIFAFMLWVLTAVTAGCFLSTVFLNYNTPVKIEVENLRVRRVSDYTTDSGFADVANFDFSIKADVTKLFNWNVKQLFFYLVAEYATADNKVNQVVVWDRIVERHNRVLLDERSLRPKYWLLDEGGALKSNENVTFVLRYNVVPNAGYLRLAQAEGEIKVEMPSEYTKGRN